MIWPFTRSEPIETKAPSGTSVPAEWMFELFGGGVVADYAVTGQQALEVPAVSSAISLISGSIASLGILVEKREGRGGSVCLNSLVGLMSGLSAGFRPLREAVG